MFIPLNGATFLTGNNPVLISVCNADIKQGSWIKLDNTTRLRREFKYEIDYHSMLGRYSWKSVGGLGLMVDIGNISKRSVIDYQTIEMQDDHLYSHSYYNT